MADKMREALCDAAMQPTLDEIVKAAIANGVEDAPNPKNEMRHKRIASMVRSLFAERWQAAQSEQSVPDAGKACQIPVMGEPVAWRWAYAQKTEDALANSVYGMPKWEGVTTFNGIPSQEAISRAILKGIVPIYLYRRPTTSITEAELERLRKDAWQGIETAPTDGTYVDLYGYLAYDVTDIRLTNCAFTDGEWKYFVCREMRPLTDIAFTPEYWRPIIAPNIDAAIAAEGEK